MLPHLREFFFLIINLQNCFYLKQLKNRIEVSYREQDAVFCWVQGLAPAGEFEGA